MFLSMVAAPADRMAALTRDLYVQRYNVAASRAKDNFLAALSHEANLSIGCYCEREERCHRSLLRELLRQADAKLG